MKNIQGKAAVWTVGLAMIAAPAFAGGSSSVGVPSRGMDTSTLILNHSVVVSIGELLNEKHAGQCTLPTTPQDIQWRCMGAFPRVTQPTIYPSSCGFSVEIKCPGETATLSGMTRSYSLLTRSGIDRRVVPTDTLIMIDDVQFAAGN